MQIKLHSIQKVKVCTFACHSHDYCRTANYYSIDSICSLYEESIHVGKIVSSLSTTVINIQLLPLSPAMIIMITELMYVPIAGTSSVEV